MADKQVCGKCHHIQEHAVAPFCGAMRLPDPDGNYHQLPTRPNAPASAFHFEADEDKRKSSFVQRMVSRGAAYGYYIKLQTGESIACDYNIVHCPSYVRGNADIYNATRKRLLL